MIDEPNKKEIEEATKELKRKAKIDGIFMDSIYSLEIDDKILIVTPPNRAKQTHDCKIYVKETYEMKQVLNFPLKFWTKIIIYRRFLNFLEDNGIVIEDEKALNVSLEKAYEKYIKKEEMQQKERPELSIEEIQEANKLATAPDVLVKILEFKIKELLHAGEEKNFLNLYLTATSRKLPNPNSNTIKGASSGGKNHTVKNVLKFLPEEDIIDFTRLTAQALYYSGQLNFRNKILYIYEREGSEASNYSIRSLQSEGKLKLGIPIKNPKTGNIEMKYIIVEGPIAYIETTTKATGNQENETRCFDLFIDESEKQTKEIFRIDGEQILPIDEEKLIIKIKPFQDMQRILNVVDVIIPYKSLINFPAIPVRVRRDRHKFLAMIEASAIVHQKQRQEIVINNKRYIIATLFDYEIAKLLCTDIIADVIRNLNPKTEQIIEAAKEISEKSETFTYKDLMLKLDWAKSTISEWCKPAIEHGYFNVSEGGRGKPYVLTYNRDAERDYSSSQLLSIKQLSDLILQKGSEIQDLLNRSGIHLENIHTILSLTKEQKEILDKLYKLLSIRERQSGKVQNKTQNDNIEAKECSADSENQSRTPNDDQQKLDTKEVSKDE